MKKGFFWIIVLAYAAFSCSSNDATPSKTQLLTQTTWLFSGGASTDPNVQSIMSFLTGSFYNFYNDNTYRLTVKNVPAISTWEFSADQSSIIFGKGTVDERTVKIVLLTATEFQIEEITSAGSTTYYYTKKA